MSLSRRDLLGVASISPLGPVIGRLEKLATPFQIPEVGTVARTFAPLARARVDAIAKLLPAAPKGFGTPISDRAAWDQIARRPELKKTLADAEKLLTAPIPAWNEDAYFEFSRNGQRVAGQDMMAARWKFVVPLAWAECCENKGRFLDKLDRAVLEIANQPAWCLPAHDGKLDSYHGKAIFVDLGASGYAHELAQVLFMMGDRLPAETGATVLASLERLVFAPMHKTYLSGKGHWWLYSLANWNSVCLSGVTGAALAALTDVHDRAVFAAAAEYYAINNVVGFGSDGYCAEGIGYYNYGFGHYILLRELLWQQTRGDIDLFEPKRVNAIATFGPRLEILPGTWPAYADCRIGSQVATEMLWYCSRTKGLGLTKYDNAKVLVPSQIARGVMQAFPNSTERPPKASAKMEPVGLRSYFDQAGVISCRPALGSACRVGASFKGGHNDEPHNHNDLGSYAIIVDDVQVAGDGGGPHTYTGQMFSDKRYTYKILNSFGHPVPLIDDVQQRPGKEARARVVKTHFADDRDEFSLDLSLAYEIVDLKVLRRDFVYDRTGAGSVTITDLFDFGKPHTYEVAFVTHGSWKSVGEKEFLITNKGKSLRLTVECDGPISVRSETIEENAPKFERVGVALSSPQTSAQIRFSFTPVPA